MFGIFIFENGGILSGLEVYSLAADAPQVLPTPEQLRPWSEPKVGDAAREQLTGHSDG
jgi:hypothetical protein